MGQRRQTLPAVALAATMIGAPGCMVFHCKPIPLAPECATACADVPCECRGKVYVFLMSGWDLLDLDGVNDFRAALIRAGFTKVYNGQCYHDSFFASEMHRIALEEPDTRFVVVGFSGGAAYAVSLAESVNHYHIPITLLASVDPYWWSSAQDKMPANVQQVMNIHGGPSYLAEPSSAGIDVRLPVNRSESVSSNPMAVETLARTLANLAGTLPAPPRPAAVMDRTDEGQTPRPATRTEGPRDSWDFLKPVTSLRSPNPSDPTVSPAPNGERTVLRPAQPASPN